MSYSFDTDGWDAAGIAETGHLIGKPLNLIQLSGEKGKEGIRFPAGAVV